MMELKIGSNSKATADRNVIDNYISLYNVAGISWATMQIFVLTFLLHTNLIFSMFGDSMHLKVHSLVNEF